MGVLDAAIQGEAMGRQKNAELIGSITGGLEAITNIRKDNKFKAAGRMLSDLGGLSKENLKQVVTKFDFSPEETKEFVTTVGAFEETMARMRGKTRDVYNPEGKLKTVGENEPIPEGYRSKTGWDIKRGEKGKTTYKKFGNELIKIGKDGKLEVIRTMSIEGRAVTNAMADPEWHWANETEQAKLIEKHKRFLIGETKVSPLKQYKNAEEVRAAFKAGELPKEEALKILREQFGMK